MVVKSQFTEIFEQFLKDYEGFPEIYEIIKRNSRGRGRRDLGKIWLIGGFVYKPIIKSIYPDLKVAEPSQTDIDFLIEKPPAKEDLYIPPGWDPKVTESGFFYLEKGKIRLDLGYLFSFHSIGSVARVLDEHPRFRYFFRATPMDIQAIAYDLTDRNFGVIGKPGINAIKNKIVRVNYLQEAQFEANKRKLTLEDFVKEKADELGFGYDTNPIHSYPE